MREPSAPQKIFVYGTLMKGFYNYERALAGQEVSQVPARIRGRVWHMTNRGYRCKGRGWLGLWRTGRTERFCSGNRYHGQH